jgi:long-chain acyl-CoA synthetase
MRNANETILITGATGLVGGAVLQRMLRDDPDLQAVVLVRDLARWRAAARRLGIPTARVTPVLGDVREAGCGLTGQARAWLGDRVTTVIHAAADIMFSRSLAESRATNVAGVTNVVETVAEWPRARRIAHVSTTYVAGRRTGLIRETDAPHQGPWVNPYEQSKAEAEAVLRSTDREWVILRSGYIVCDSPVGQVSQYNAMHLALRFLHDGRAPVIPGSLRTGIDLVTTDYVAAAIATLARHPGAAGRAFHLSAGTKAMSLGEVFEQSWRVWSECPAWRARRVTPPRFVGALAYRLLSAAVGATGDNRMAKAARALSHFVPHLGLAQQFDTTQADTLLGFSAPSMRDYWPRMLKCLKQANWGAEARRAAA